VGDEEKWVKEEITLRDQMRSVLSKEALIK
jgi:hypothetical protein